MLMVTIRYYERVELWLIGKGEIEKAKDFAAMVKELYKRIALLDGRW